MQVAILEGSLLRVTVVTEGPGEWQLSRYFLVLVFAQKVRDGPIFLLAIPVSPLVVTVEAPMTTCLTTTIVFHMEGVVQQSKTPKTEFAKSAHG